MRIHVREHRRPGPVSCACGALLAAPGQAAVVGSQLALGHRHMAVEIEQMQCHECGLGAASGLGAGGFCPFIERTHADGEIIYREGESVRHIWFIKRGAMVLHRKRGNEREPGRVRTVRFVGGFVGMEALISPTYIDTARTAGQTSVCIATVDGFEQWLGPKGTPARMALESTVQSMIADLPPRAAADGSAAQRVAGWLTEEGPSGGTLQLPRRVIADLLGMRPETLSRALAALAARGAILVSRTNLDIVDPDALSNIARSG